MAKIQPVWAIDVGQAALKALKLVPGEVPGQVTAEAFDYIEYPKILSQPDADPDELVREALETLLERNDLKGCKVAIAVPGQAGLVKFIKLPPVEKKRIPDIVKFEARQQIPFALEEVIWDYQQIGGDDGDSDEDFTMAEVGLFAMKRDQITRAILPLKRAGIEVDFVQMGPLALYNMITFDKLKGAEEKGTVILLDIGADKTDLVITDGVRIWQRNVPVGGNHFTRALTKELKLTFAKAEHLKRNATKAPDPKAVFTAMRTVFNDFSSEVNRSIGFYMSINRGATIRKVIGLGNGFKLPGLQKFLQQNLSHEVERCDAFDRLNGDEVIQAPQFQENLASFSVAYGLAVQGLGKSALRTNLLPPEIEQARMVRRKQPWALAASVLLMLGASALFFGDYKLLAAVDTSAYKSAVQAAKGASDKGAGFASNFQSAKGEWDTKLEEGKKLVVPNSDRATWPQFLKTINAHFPDAAAVVKRAGLNPEDPKNRPALEKVRVYIDAIKPVWRTDVATEWYDTLPDWSKRIMHPMDRAEAPTGEGWVIQVVGHHYNPLPVDIMAERKKAPNQRLDFGPLAYLRERVLPLFSRSAELRQKGMKSFALTWFIPDRNWTTEQGTSVAALAPLLQRATAPVDAAGGGMEGGMMAGGMTGMPGMGGGMGSGMMSGSGGMMPGMGRGMGGMEGGEMGGYGGMMGGGMMGYGMGAGADAAKRLTKLTRTDFMIQFLWQPPEPKTGTPEEQKEALLTELKEIQAKIVEAEKGPKAGDDVQEKDVEASSLAESKKAAAKIEQQVAAEVKAQGAQPPAGTAAPADGATPPAAPTSPTPPDAKKGP